MLIYLHTIFVYIIFCLYKPIQKNTHIYIQMETQKYTSPSTYFPEGSNKET